MHVYVFTHAHMYEYQCPFLRMWRLEDSLGCLPQSFYTLVSEIASLSLNLELMGLTKMAGQQAPRIGGPLPQC